MSAPRRLRLQKRGEVHFVEDNAAGDVRVTERDDPRRRSRSVASAKLANGQ